MAKPVAKSKSAVATPVVKKNAASGNGADTKQHRIPGVKAKAEPKVEPAVSQKTALNNLLGQLSKKAGAQPKKKSEKPVIVLEDKAQELLRYQEARAEMKALEGTIAQLEEELLPECEVHRLAICAARQEYIGSIHVQATGEDDEGADIEAGQAVYYVQHKYSGFDPFAPSTDDEIRETFGDDATLKHEAIASIISTLADQGTKVSFEEAEKLFDERMETKANISLVEGALTNPKVIAILQEHLAEYLVSKTTVTPTDGFSERASYNGVDRAIMAALNNISLCRRAKPVLKSSGAPKQK